MWTATNFIIKGRIGPYGRRLCTVVLDQWCSNRGPQGPLEWPAKQFLWERKLNTLIQWRSNCGPWSNFHWKENLTL